MSLGTASYLSRITRRTYLAVLPALAAFGELLFRVGEQLLGANLGTNWSLIGTAEYRSGRAVGK